MPRKNKWAGAPKKVQRVGPCRDCGQMILNSDIFFPILKDVIGNGHHDYVCQPCYMKLPGLSFDRSKADDFWGDVTFG